LASDDQENGGVELAVAWQQPQVLQQERMVVAWQQPQVLKQERM
jgi:hypothetical protein